MLGFIITMIIIGIIAGYLARLLVPGRDPMGCLGTILLGVVGSVIGGFLVRLLMRPPGDEFHPSGLIGAVIGGVIALLIYRKLAGPRVL